MHWGDETKVSCPSWFVRSCDSFSTDWFLHRNDRNKYLCKSMRRRRNVRSITGYIMHGLAIRAKAAQISVRAADVFRTNDFSYTRNRSYVNVTRIANKSKESFMEITGSPQSFAFPFFLLRSTYTGISKRSVKVLTSPNINNRNVFEKK